METKAFPASTDTKTFKQADAITLYVAPEKLTLDIRGHSHFLTISRDDAFDTSVRVEQKKPGCQSTPIGRRKEVVGVLGMAQTPLSSVLILISQRIKVGEIAGHHVWQVLTTDLTMVCHRNSSSKKEYQTHQKCLAMLQSVLSTPHLYFSTTMDLTQSQQRLYEEQQRWGTASLTGGDAWNRIDKRFLFNQHLLMPFTRLNNESVYAFLTPCIQGACFIQRACYLNRQTPFTWALLTRRSQYRTGSRYFVRGTDEQGNPANYCETEQLVEVKGRGLASYVQTRGSMPFPWSQAPNIRYKPSVRITDSAVPVKTQFEAHLREEIRRLGDQVLVNLIDSSKVEGRLEAFFRQLVETADLVGVTYEYFDFHKECSKMRYENLSKLMNQLLPKYDFGYFYLPEDEGRTFEGNANRVLLQTGCFRTNCMDCLDRTNVVQSLLAEDALLRILINMKILPLGSDDLRDLRCFEDDGCAFYEHVYRPSWADHADLVSLQYAGTGAMKTDYTRTGKRTKRGLFLDLLNASTRYIKNNFSDGFRTDAVNYFVGDLTVREAWDGLDLMEELRNSAGCLIHAPKTILVSFLLIFFGVLTLDVFTCIVGIIVAFFSIKFILDNYEFFIDWPTSYLLGKDKNSIKVRADDEIRFEM